MSRILLRELPEATLGYDGHALAITGGFRGLAGVPPGFHRIELPGAQPLDVVVARGDEVQAFALRAGALVPAPSVLDAAARDGALDHALFDVAALPARAWRALTSQLVRTADAQAWRRTAPDDWPRAVLGLQGAWLAVNAGDDAAGGWIVALVDACAAVDAATVARHPASFAALLDAVVALRGVAGELARGLIAELAPLIAIARATPAVALAAARLTAG